MSDPFQESYRSEDTEVIFDHESLARRDSTVAQLHRDSPETHFDGNHFWVRFADNFISFDKSDFKDLLSNSIADKADRAALLVHILTNQRVAWAGKLAGFRPGIHQLPSGEQILVTAGPKILTSESYDTPEWDDFILRLLGTDQLPYFHGWLSHCLKSYYSAWYGGDEWGPGQALVIVGKTYDGKSILMEFLALLLGGRAAKPFRYISGATQFNFDAAGAELLIIDDEMSNPSLAARRLIGAQVKQICVAYGQSIHKKGKDAVTLHPRWRLAFAINDSPFDLAVLPPLEVGFKDKMMIFRSQGKAVPTTTRKDFSDWKARIIAELPAVVGAMLSYTIPEAQTDSRYGIKPYCDPVVESQLADLAPTAKLEQLIRDEIQSNVARSYKARDIERQLRVGKRSKEADLLFHGSPRICGHLLGELSRRRPDLVAKVTVNDGIQLWRIAAESAEFPES
jgi:hypothetical protein